MFIQVNKNLLTIQLLVQKHLVKCDDIHEETTRDKTDGIHFPAYPLPMTSEYSLSLPFIFRIIYV